ncbi:MAG: sirohydrochlorin cobaltochelatase [Blautia sp.]|nr:sirohydrochlorin cobaltochelatase [Blautia sp.]
MSEKALLVVSFGTSYADTRKKTIEVLEKRLAGEFPDRTFYRAWTSGVIIRKLKKSGLVIDTVAEAMERIRADGCTDLLVQPTHMLNGYENEAMKKTIREAGGFLEKLSFGAPLLNSPEDLACIKKAVQTRFSFLKDTEALVLMGHGSPEQGNEVYEKMRRSFADASPSIFLGTVEAVPDFNDVLQDIEKKKPSRICLAPFLIVAGDHASNDLAGAEPDSWKSRLEALGYETEAVLEGLGEYKAVQELLVLHAKEARAEQQMTGCK